MRTWIRIAVVVLLVLSSIVAPVAAQVDGESDPEPILPGEEEIETDDGDTDDESTADDDSEAESESPDGDDEDEGGGLLGGGGLMPSMPSAGEWLEDAIEWFWEDVAGGVEAYANLLDEAFVGIAAPGNPFEPLSWVMPDGLWSVPAAFYVAGSSIASVLWAAGLVYVFDIKSRQKQREVLQKIIYAVLGTLFGMVLLGLYFNAINLVSTGISPDGTDFVQDGAGLAQLGLGHVVVLILLAINSGVVLVGGLIMFGIYLLPLVLFALWPFIVASKAVPVKSLQSVANLGLTTLGLLPVLRIAQALLLRLADMMIWEAAGIAEQIASLFGTALILAVALLVLPWIFYQNIETASGMALSTITVRQANRGAARANDAARQASSRVAGRAKQAAAPYVNSARSTANQTAANAKFQAGSRIGGAILTAKFGQPGHQTPAQAANSTSPPENSASSSTSRPRMPEQAANQSRTARTRAINRQRRDARKRRSTRGD